LEPNLDAETLSSRKNARENYISSLKNSSFCMTVIPPSQPRREKVETASATNPLSQW